MQYQTIIINDIPHGIEVMFNRVNQRNALNSTLILELHDLLDQADQNEKIRIVVLKGQHGFFCTGMDFTEAFGGATLQKATATDPAQFASQYMGLLKRFSTTNKIIISAIDGLVLAGGVGIVAASDIVLATSNSKFSLSEALWGLLPANVIPFLIRRVGFHKAYYMTLTTQTLTAKDAHDIYLVDELSDDLSDAIRKQVIRLSRLDARTIHDLKAYFRKMWFIDETMEQMAIDELARLVQEPRILQNIKAYLEHGKFPWEAP